MRWLQARTALWRTARTASEAAASGSRAAVATARWTSAAYQRTTRVMHRLTGASGAGHTGLASLIELTAAGSAGDAFVAVSLAGTLFFSASPDQARGRVALALLVTMAPFAVLAPLIGPMLDRVQQGRRYLLAGTLLARGLLCWGMSGAVFHNDTVTLLPAAFGVLVLQKAYGVTRSAVTPRVLPDKITLVAANARIGLASLVASTVAALVAAGVDVAFGGGVGGAAWVLRLGTVVYLGATALSFAVPDRVDAGDEQLAPLPGQATPQASTPAAGAAGPSAATRRTAGNGGPAMVRWRTLARVGPAVGEAMGANATLRAFSGFMIFFLAFLLRIVHFPGVNDKVALAAMIASAAVGGFLGTAVGAALRARRPALITFGMLAAATLVTAGCAAFFGLGAALVVSLVAAFGQVLGKLALDSTVQDDIGEEIRSSTFAVSETLHQLSWVAGGLVGLALSLTSSGVAGLAVAASGLAVSLTFLVLRRRRRILDARRARMAAAT
ncbi:MAG TPA: MFS transporter [Streptosporangiaceae bacterium]|nr:MFS transporter [Streptosporangiaceae bacterium]